MQITNSRRSTSAAAFLRRPSPAIAAAMLPSPPPHTSITTSAAAAPPHHRKRCRPRHYRPSFPLRTFGDPGCPATFYGPFRDNVRAFLHCLAEREPPCPAADSHGLLHYHHAWSVALHHDVHARTPADHEALIIPLLVIEEDVRHSATPHCQHCRSVGWGHHLISSRRYHFIVPSPEISVHVAAAAAAESASTDSPAANLIAAACARKICPMCRVPMPLSLGRCQLCDSIAVPGGVFHVQNHLLHGLLHCNGYGHLLRLNGRERGSPYASGTELMDLWDRICTMLRARKVTVKDVAKKRATELRLLHSIGYGQPWFGRWGYKFGHGSFGITQHIYAKAIEAIRGMPLSVMLQHFHSMDDVDGVAAIAAKYQRLSGETLQTVGDLVRFVMELKARIDAGTANANSAKYGGDAGTAPSAVVRYEKLDFYGAKSPCRWSAKRLELATQVIVEALKSCEKRWMARQELRDAARAYIGDTGLLDFVLKSLGNRMVGPYVVRRVVNPFTKVLEYSLHDARHIGGGDPSVSSTAINHLNHAQNLMFKAACCDVERVEAHNDILCLYRNILECYKPATVPAADIGARTTDVLVAISAAARIISDTKHMMKDYEGEISRRCVNSGNKDDDRGMVEEGEEMLLRVTCGLNLEGFDDDKDAGAEGAEVVDNNHHREGTAAEAEVRAEARIYGDGACSEGLLVDDDLMLGGGGGVTRLSEDAQRKKGQQRRKMQSNKERWKRRIETAAESEVVMVPPDASVAELKRAAEWAFRDTYCAMRGLRVRTMEGVEEEDPLMGNMASSSGCHVVLRGSISMAPGGGEAAWVLWFEGGSESWTVDCRCGATEDDGERMVACDECEVWQHVRCAAAAAIRQTADALPPPRFLCAACAAAAAMP